MKEAFIAGFFADAGSIAMAAEKMREAGYNDFEVYSPYPIDGLESGRNGLKRSRIPYFAFGAGLLGAALAFIFQYWVSVVASPINVGGKPLNAWPAFIPVVFEVAILFAGLATFVAFIVESRLPDYGRNIFDTTITQNRFAIMIRVTVEDEGGVIDFMKSIGATEVRND